MALAGGLLGTVRCIAEPLPAGLAALVADLAREGFSLTNETVSGPMFHEVLLTNPDRSLGRVVKLTKDRGLWDVGVSLEGDAIHDPNMLLLAFNGAEHVQRNLCHDEMRISTLRVLATMPRSSAALEAVYERLRAVREDYNRRHDGTEATLAKARRHFVAGDYQAAARAYAQIADERLPRSEQMRRDIAIRRACP